VFPRTPALAAALLLAALAPLAPSLAAPSAAPSLAPALAGALHVDAAALDAGPVALRAAVQAWDARLGVARAPGALDVLDAVEPSLAAPVARLLNALLQAQAIRDEAFAGIADAEILWAMEHSSDPRAQAIAARAHSGPLRTAAVGLAAVVDATLPELQAYRASLPGATRLVSGPPTIDVPPVLVMDPTVGDTIYTKDAVLAIDVGGNDLYDMNAGGGIIGIGLIDTDPSTCQLVLGSVAIGCEEHDATQTVTAALAIDLAGDDTYGFYEPPRPGGRDIRCTSDLIIREIVLQGSASGGLGMLVDATGNDVYNGKTLAQGNGHVAGVGVFFDLTGDDTYNVIREGPGSAALGAAGFFQDLDGNDRYDYHSPTGGIWNADSGRCDATARFGLGASIIAGSANFLDAQGDDVYRIESQAFGNNGGAGTAVFVDAGGNDDYGGFPGVGNGVQVQGAGTLFKDV
jgi:hypothetical protein